MLSVFMCLCCLSVKFYGMVSVVCISLCLDVYSVCIYVLRNVYSVSIYVCAMLVSVVLHNVFGCVYVMFCCSLYVYSVCCYLCFFPVLCLSVLLFYFEFV